MVGKTCIDLHGDVPSMRPSTIRVNTWVQGSPLELVPDMGCRERGLIALLGAEHQLTCIVDVLNAVDVNVPATLSADMSRVTSAM